MKMSATLIVGLVLILLGVSALIKVFFDIDIPLLKIAFAGLLIYIGIRILTGNSFVFSKDREADNSVFFGERNIANFEDGKEYNTFFGSSTYDFNYIPDSGTDARIKVNTIFGSSKIILGKNINVKIKSNTVFGGTSLPNGDQTAFGSSEYDNSALSDSSATLTIESNTIFGGLKVLRE
jgi:predicted membrane protein